MERVTDLERIARGYADLCVTAFAYDGLTTIEALRQYNDSREGLGFQKPAGGADIYDYIQVSEIHLTDDDLTKVAGRIDELIAAGEY